MPLSFNEFNLITERNRSSVSLFDSLKPYANDPSYFVTFTTIEKVGINPTNVFSTPIGIYAYSLKDLWKHWVAGDFFFGKDRPFVNLLKANMTKVLRLKEYRFNSKDISFLRKEYEISNRDGVSFDEFLSNAKEEIRRDTNIYSNSSDGALLWYCTNKIALAQSGAKNKSFTVKWNKLFRDLGYDAIYDNNSIIHLLQSSQAVFFTPNSYKVISRFPNKNLFANDLTHWGTTDQPFWHPGENPAVDILVKAKIDNTTKILLVKRKGDLTWALPGGFIHTDAAKGEPFEWGRETPKQAALRVLTEETQLYVGAVKAIGSKVRFVAKFDSMSRDSRNNKEAWSASHLFTLELDAEDGIDLNKVGKQGGTSDVRWFDSNAVPKLSFDHNKLINKTI
jgi:ADP-ribose pyrophosphatase YjhB (NUDIX family)